MRLMTANILDLVKENGEDAVQALISPFSCCKQMTEGCISLNPDIEHFLKNDAISFAQKKISVSYLVMDETNGDVLGYFTFTHKVLEVPATGLSKTKIRTMERYAELDESEETYLVSAFLLAQFGKNYAIDNGTRLTGHEMMRRAMNELAEIQHRVGGGIVYLDCEADANLIHFYENEGFRLFGERISENDGKRYLQYMKFF